DRVFGSAYAVEGSGAKMILAALLGMAAIFLGVVWIKAKNWWPIELSCPACGLRLEKWGPQIGCCPGCAVDLHSAPAEESPLRRSTSSAPLQLPRHQPRV